MMVRQVTERIEKLRMELNLSKSEFCSIIEFSQANYSNITGSRGSKPGVELVEKIALHIKNINLHWLLTGKGNMFLDVYESDDQETLTIVEQSREYQAMRKNSTDTAMEIMNLLVDLDEE